MYQGVPWNQLLALMEPFYPKAGRLGRQPDALDTTLSIHFFQQWSALSDLAMEEAFYDSLHMCCFAQLSENDAIIHVTTIVLCRRLLKIHRLAEPDFCLVNAYSCQQRIEHTRRDDRRCHVDCCVKRDEDLPRSARCAEASNQRNPWYFGMKAHIGLDDVSGLVHPVHCMAANGDNITPVHRQLFAEKKRGCGRKRLHRGGHARKMAAERG